MCPVLAGVLPHFLIYIERLEVVQPYSCFGVCAWGGEWLKGRADICTVAAKERSGHNASVAEHLDAHPGSPTELVGGLCVCLC